MPWKYVYGTNNSETINAADGVTAGNDWIIGGGGHDTIYGLGGDDAIWGGTGNDTLNGGIDDDHLDGGIGNDTLEGWTGDDTYYVDSFWDVVTESGGEGYDTVYTSVGWALTPGADVEVLRTTSDTGTAPIYLTGNATGNAIIGNDGNNIINGGGGEDQMTGRDGDDTYFVDNRYDEVFEAGGQGYDTVRVAVNYTLPEGADVERLTTTNPGGLAGYTLIGNSSGNVIVGDNGSNDLLGRGGNDELIGLGGVDYFVFFDTPLDAATNVDFLSDFNPGEDIIALGPMFGLDDDLFSADQFVVGVAAQDADDYLVYDIDTGALSFDADGAGGADAIQFARLNPGVPLTYLDFFID